MKPMHATSNYKAALDLRAHKKFNARKQTQHKQKKAQQTNLFKLNFLLLLSHNPGQRLCQNIDNTHWFKSQVGLQNKKNYQSSSDDSFLLPPTESTLYRFSSIVSLLPSIFFSKIMVPCLPYAPSFLFHAPFKFFNGPTAIY